MFAFANRPLSIREVWSASIKLYINSIIKVWYLALILGLVFAFQPYLIWYFQSVTTLYNAVEIRLLVFFLTTAVAAFIIPIAICMMYAIATDQPTNLPIFFRYVGKRYGKLLLTVLLIYLMITWISFPLSILGYILSIFLIFSIPCALFDDVGAFSALGLSFKLVWGNWWRSFLLLVPVATTLVLLILWIQGLFQAGTLGAGIAGAVFFGVLFPFLFALWLNTYIDVVLRYLAKTPTSPVSAATPQAPSAGTTTGTPGAGAV